MNIPNIMPRIRTKKLNSLMKKIRKSIETPPSFLVSVALGFFSKPSSIEFHNKPVGNFKNSRLVLRVSIVNCRLKTHLSRKKASARSESRSLPPYYD